MANNFGRVNVSVTASTGGLTAGLNRAKSSLSGFSSAVSVLKSPLSMLGSVAKSTFGQLALFSAASGAVSALTGMASGAAESVDQLSKLSRRLGTTYSELAGLKLAGDLAGVGIEEIGKAMTKADVALVNARNGSKKATAAFATLGLTAEQLAGMSSADRFEAIATAISSLPDSASRAAAAIALFGKSGAEILPLFEGGAGGIRQAREEAEKLGLALTNKQGQAVEEMNDSFTRVYYAIQGIVQQVTARLAPAVTEVATRFTDFVKEAGGVTIGKSIGAGIIEGAKYLATVADMVVNQFRQLYFKVADALGVATSREAKRLSEMQVQLNAGTAPEVAVPGSGGFVTKLDPAFAAEFDALTKAVQAQREEVFPLNELVADAERAMNAIGNMVDAAADRAANALSIKELQAIEGELNSIKNPFRQWDDSARIAIGQVVVGAAEAAEKLMRGGEAVAESVLASSRELKAIVVGTAEGEAFRNMLARGGDPRTAKDHNAEIADNTERAADEIEGLRDDMAGMFALAAIQV